MKIKTQNNFNWHKFFFTTSVETLIKDYETNKFIKSRFSQPKLLFDKDYLLAAMPHNVIYFCVWNWELANKTITARSTIFTSNKFNLIATVLNLQNIDNYFNKFNSNDIFTWNSFSNQLLPLLARYKLLFFSNFNLIRDEFARFKTTERLNVITKPNFKYSNSIETPKLRKPVWSFLMVRSTKNNFFVTVIDSQGHTLVTWTGGNSERTGTRQRATVFSADSAVYEACFLAKQRGVESLSLHVRSTFWLPQVKNCFEGLEASGLLVEEMIYWPLKAFGGCRLKKPRRV